MDTWSPQELPPTLTRTNQQCPLQLINMNNLPRRDRFITMVALGVAVGVAIVPQWAQGALWPVHSGMSRVERGIRDGIIILIWTWVPGAG